VRGFIELFLYHDSHDGGCRTLSDLDISSTSVFLAEQQVSSAPSSLYDLECLHVSFDGGRQPFFLSHRFQHLNFIHICRTVFNSNSFYCMLCMPSVTALQFRNYSLVELEIGAADVDRDISSSSSSVSSCCMKHIMFIRCMGMSHITDLKCEVSSLQFIQCVELFTISLLDAKHLRHILITACANTGRQDIFSCFAHCKTWLQHLLLFRWANISDSTIVRLLADFSALKAIMLIHTEITEYAHRVLERGGIRVQRIWSWRQNIACASLQCRPCKYM